MEQQQLKNLKTWFTDYVAGFYGSDQYVNANIKLKEDHTYRTCEETLYLAEHLALDDDEKLIAETIALLHDVGRFEQFVKYRTYNDPRSVNHCVLGLEVIEQYRLLKDLSDGQQDVITTAIRLHGELKLPDEADEGNLLFAKLIRDADKIDILYVVTEYYKQYAENPDEFKLEVELPDVDEYSPEVVADVVAGRRTDYRNLRSLNEIKLVQLGWVYDVNFAATLKRIKQRGLLEKLSGFLPQSPEIERAKTAVMLYVNRRIAKAAEQPLP